MARDGVVAQDQKDLLKLNNHPVRSIKGASRYFLDVASTPPDQEGQSIAPDLAFKGYFATFFSIMRSILPQIRDL